MLNTGQVVTDAQLEAAKAQLGLDKPFLVQYITWLNDLLHGDMGVSFVSGMDVFDTFISKLPATLFLTVTSIVLTVIISIPLGIISAVYKNKFWDYFIRFFFYGLEFQFIFIF